MHWQIPTITVTFWKTLIRRDYSTFMRRRWHLTWLFSWRAPYKNIHTVLDVLDLYVNTQCTGNAKYQVAAFKHVAQWNQKTHMGFCLWNYWVQAFQNVTHISHLLWHLRWELWLARRWWARGRCRRFWDRLGAPLSACRTTRSTSSRSTVPPQPEEPPSGRMPRCTPTWRHPELWRWWGRPLLNY